MADAPPNEQEHGDGQPFSPGRTAALAYILLRDGGPPSGERLAWLMMLADFRAYQTLGRSITGATYVRGPVHPEIREFNTGWFERAARLYVRRTSPWWAKLTGWSVALTVAGLAIVKPRRR